MTAHSRAVVITALSMTQILAWGSSYYLLAVLAVPISTDTGWPLPWVVGGLSLGLLVAGLVSRRVGWAIGGHGCRPVLAGSALLLGIGLAALGAAPNVGWYLVAWAILGLGMGAFLYDAAFASLGWLYREKARSAISICTSERKTPRQRQELTRRRSAHRELVTGPETRGGADRFRS